MVEAEDHKSLRANAPQQPGKCPQNMEAGVEEVDITRIEKVYK
jgi:hypothetical protein